MVDTASGHPFLKSLLGDQEVGAYFSAAADIDAMLRFEAALARAEADVGVIPPEAADAIASVCDDFHPDMETLAADTARDGVVVPGLVRALREAVGEPYAGHVHFGATSQDVIDTGLILRLRDVVDILDTRLAALVDQLSAMDAAQGHVEIMGRTRMQRALPMTFGDRLRGWTSALERHRTRLDAIKSRLLRVQFGGAVGTLDKLGDKGPAVIAALAEHLALSAPAEVWHSARDTIVEFAGWLALVSGTNGKIGQDIALMAQNEIAEVEILTGGGSSAMPHKNNPIAAETLVTLARFNAGQAAAMQHAMVHEHERSGAAWTLEWMVLPQMTETAAASLRTCRECLEGIRISES